MRRADLRKPKRSIGTAGWGRRGGDETVKTRPTNRERGRSFFFLRQKGGVWGCWGSGVWGCIFNLRGGAVHLVGQAFPRQYALEIC